MYDRICMYSAADLLFAITYWQSKKATFFAALPGEEQRSAVLQNSPLNYRRSDLPQCRRHLVDRHSGVVTPYAKDFWQVQADENNKRTVNARVTYWVHYNAAYESYMITDVAGIKFITELLSVSVSVYLLEQHASSLCQFLFSVNLHHSYDFHSQREREREREQWTVGHTHREEKINSYATPLSVVGCCCGWWYRFFFFVSVDMCHSKQLWNAVSVFYSVCVCVRARIRKWESWNSISKGTIIEKKRS